MSSTDDSASLDRERAILGSWRAQIEQGRDWPASADRLWSQLAQSTSAASSAEEEHELLSLIVNDALKDIDVSTRYPEFFRRLLADEDLRQAFLEALELMESDLADDQEFIPQASELSFLRAKSSQPIIQRPSQNQWRVIWQQTIDQLQTIFFPPHLAPEPAYRHTENFEDAWFTLFRSDVEVNHTQLAVSLEAAWQSDAPDALNVQLAIGITADPVESAAPFLDLRAMLDWGDYSTTVVVGQRGRASFPPIPLTAILDEINQRITSNLSLSLEPALSS